MHSRLIAVASLVAVAGVAPAVASAAPVKNVPKTCKAPTVRTNKVSTILVNGKKVRVKGCVTPSKTTTQPGPVGPKGDTGAPGVATNGVNGTNGIDGKNGVDGAPGAPGKDGATALVANVTTSPQPTVTGLVPLAAEQSSVFDSTKGSALVSVSLPAGHYVIAGTAAFYAIGASTGQYGEARLFADTTPVGSSIFSGEIAPAALGGVGADATASVELTLTATTTVTFRGRVRDTVAGPSNVQAGANLLVTRVTP